MGRSIMNKKSDRDRRVNNKKGVAFSGIYSILGVWGSAAYILADILLSDIGAAAISLLIMVAIIAISAIINKAIREELNRDHKSKRANKWIETIKKYSEIAGYTGIIVLVISFLVNLFKLTNK